jgi:hypothetical protein
MIKRQQIVKKFCAYAESTEGVIYVEHSDNLKKLTRLIHKPDVVKVIIYEAQNGRKLQTLKSKIHI